MPATAAASSWVSNAVRGKSSKRALAPKHAPSWHDWQTAYRPHPACRHGCDNPAPPLLAGIGQQRPKMATRHFRAHMRQQHALLASRREQLFNQFGRRQRGLLPGITRRTKTSRLLQIDQTIGQTGLTQTHGSPLHLRQLVTATGNQQQRLVPANCSTSRAPSRASCSACSGVK